ncbi:hypothetical protein J3R30DRAFT_3406733 [Lentinula aciculospora]|uniref:MFS general substrate transporter n=1 Tax=Lentinula aciculospora TaxID=153920 RepID=A0A9W9A4K6_9AGAR|nr:hypothetical protein J3R30DRAFT_3406733 [Lentinula aciculospora]
MSQPGDKTDRLLSTKGTSRQRRKNRAKASSPRSSSPDISSEPMPKGHKYPALSSSVELEGIQIRPRTPRTALHSENGDAVDEVELSLLNEDERRAAAASDTDLPSSRTKAGVSTKDKRGMALLIVLWCSSKLPFVWIGDEVVNSTVAQLGLALGSVPFLLREHLSYSQLGTFALAGYPYSLKLLWSPIVDSCYFPSVGRRKSWIVPMQFVIGSLMLWIANNVDVLLETFVGINAFHTRISDPLIGGTYMTSKARIESGFRVCSGSCARLH